MHIKGKPEFYDAMLLSKQSHRPSSQLSYHSIPLYQSRVTIHIREDNSRFNCHDQSLQLIEGEQPISEEEAFEMFTNFAIMVDNKVSFLIHSRRKRFKLREKVNPKNLLTHEKMEV
jgi:hypothetical protein